MSVSDIETISESYGELQHSLYRLVPRRLELSTAHLEPGMGPIEILLHQGQLRIFLQDISIMAIDSNSSLERRRCQFPIPKPVPNLPAKHIPKITNLLPAT